MTSPPAAPSRVWLRPLSDDELRPLCAGSVPGSLPPLAGPSAMPPTFVLQRAAARIAAGAAPTWWMPCLVLRAADGVAVGGCAFKWPPDDGRVDLLDGIARERRRQGLAAHAVRVLVQRAFDHGATRVRAEVDAGNEASRRTAQAGGFAPAGSWTDAAGTEVSRFERSRDDGP